MRISHSKVQIEIINMAQFCVSCAICNVTTALLGQPLDVYLADFGLSKSLNGSQLTKAGMSIGTPHYISPEQVLAAALRPQSDVYSLAVVVYEMLLGRLPFIAKRAIDVAFSTFMKRRRCCIC